MRDKLTQSRANELRNRLTRSEWRLWLYLRHRQLGGCKFRRQVPIGPYIADFACLSAALIVELDGDSHTERYRDYVRDSYLREHGFCVLRFKNVEALNETEAVLLIILAALEEAQARKLSLSMTPPP